MPVLKTGSQGTDTTALKYDYNKVAN